MRYCHECESEVGPNATECGECDADLIQSTANTQGAAPSGSDGGRLGFLGSLFNRESGTESTETRTATDGGDSTNSDDTDSTDEAADGLLASLKATFR